MTEDIRWEQRFSNYRKALKQLGDAVLLSQKRTLSDLEEQGMIQAFEFTFEMAWKVIKDFYEYQGEAGIMGSRDAFRLAFQRELIADGETWMDMVKRRNETSHTYDEKTKNRVVAAIIGQYHSEFLELQKKLGALCGSD